MCHIVGYNIAGIYHMKLSNYNKTGILGYITGCGSPGQQNFNLSFFQHGHNYHHIHYINAPKWSDPKLTVKYVVREIKETISKK